MRSLSFNPYARAAIAALIFGASACAPEIGRDPEPPSRVTPIFDPVTSTIPLPNNAAIDPTDGTLRDLPTITQENAEGEFAKWLTQLHGWLPETGIDIPFGGELDEASLTNDTVKLYAIGAEGFTELEKTISYRKVSDTVSIVTIVPAERLVPGQNYAALATTGIKDTAGNEIIAPAAIYTALNKGDIVDPNTQEILLPEIDDPATAGSLQGLHTTLVPIINAVEAGALKAGDQTITRKDIAVAFTWATATDPFTILDPTTATIPLPNTLALEADGTFPTAALPALAQYKAELKAFQDGDQPTPPRRTAQVWFDQYLDSLHGWPNLASSVPVELPVSGDIDPATLSKDTVQLWKRTADGAERMDNYTVSFVKGEDGAVSKIRLALESDLELGADYFAFATTDVKGTNGLALLPPAPIYMALQPHPVIDEMGKSLVSRLSDAQAQSIHGVKQVLAPALALAESEAQVGYKDIASMWSWFSWKDPFVVFDPTNGDVPIPNAFLINPATGKVNLPTAGAQGLQLALLSELNTRDGFSVLGDAWFSVIGELDPTTVTLYTDDAEGSAALASVNGLPALLDDDAVALEYSKEFNKIFIRMKRPLAKDTLHAGIISNRIKGVNGLPVKPTTAFVFLASPVALVDAEGKSQVAQLDDATATTLEAARKQYEQLFVGAGLATGDTRETLACAFAFTTDDNTEPLQQARARTMSKLGDAPLAAARAANDTSVVNPDDGSWATYNGPFSGGAPQDYSNIAEIQWTAEYDSMSLYGTDPLVSELGYDQMAALRVPFSVFIPRTVPGTCEPPFNVAITIHGVGGSRAGAASALANALAAPESCLASVALDLPTHGGRAEGVASLHPEMRPANSGAGFLSTNLLATRANFAQGAIDVSVLARIIKDGGLDNLTSAGAVFSDKVGLAGISLGAAIGQLAQTIDPNVNVSVLNVPPGKMTFYLTEPSNIGEGIVAGLSMTGIMPGTFAYEQTVSFVQWLADVIDPTGFAPFTTSNTLAVLSYNPADGTYGVGANVPAAQVLVQMAQGDMTTPNVATQGLATVLGAPLDKTTFMAPHGFIGDPSLAAARCARRQVAAWLSSGLSAGTAALPASLDAATCVAAGGN